MKSDKVIYVYLYEDGRVDIGHKSALSDFNITVKNGNISFVNNKSIAIKLEDFYRKNGEDMNLIKMLYPAVNWDQYIDYINRRVNDRRKV